MTIVQDLLDDKGRHVWSIAPDASVYEALQMMSDRHIGALMVTEGAKLVGVISERDYARKVILKGKASKATAVGEIMTSRVIYVTPLQTIEECMALMTNHGVRHLPVLDNDNLAGVVSIGDIVKAKISHQEFIIEQLEHFIAGR
jgi:CBS domain-containing protein